MKSRMNREIHVRFRERLKVKFLRPTRPDSAMSRFLLVVATLLGKNRAMYASQVKQMLEGPSGRGNN